jgi:hypothetical protein
MLEAIFLQLNQFQILIEHVLYLTLMTLIELLHRVNIILLQQHVRSSGPFGFKFRYPSFEPIYENEFSWLLTEKRVYQL